MPLLTPPQKTALVAAVAGTVVGVAALSWSVVQLKRHQQQASESAGVAPENWTKAQVATWLRDNGASKATIDLCLRFNLTGEILLQVTERDLYRMGVPLRDARVILAAVADLKESPVLLARTSLPSSSRQPSLARASSHPTPAQPAPGTTTSPVERFEAAWNALVRTCVLQSDDASPAEQQQRVVVYTSALLECFQALSPHEQATALALVSVEDNTSLHHPPAAAATTDIATSAAKADAGAETAALPADALRGVTQKLQPLHVMVDGFLEFLQSPELGAVSSDDFDELGARVAGQVKRVVRVCEQLPPEMGGPLLRKCEKVFEVLARRQSGEAAGTAAAAVAANVATAATAATPTASQRENGRAIMQGVLDLVKAVKDPALSELLPAQRVKALSSLVRRAEAIEALASGVVEDVARDEQILKIVQPVLQFLRDAVRVATDAAAAADSEAANGEGEVDEEAEREEGKGEEAAADAAQLNITSTDIPVIVETVQRIQETLQSAEFQHAPAEVRAQLCAVLMQRISALEDRTAGLPTPTRTAVRELLQNTKSVLAAVGNTAVAASEHAAADADGEAAAAADAEDGDTAEAGEGEEDAEAAMNDEVDEEADEGGAASAVANAVGIERYVEQLEKIFEFLTSEALEHAPADERVRMAVELMQRVDKIRGDIAGSPAEGPIAKELIEPLYDLLKNMTTSQAPSKQFLDITAPLRDVQELLNSAAFQQVPHTEKMRIARGIVPQLQRLTAAFSTLPPSERAAAEELVHPISEELLRIVRERPTAEVSAQSVLARLQGVMRTIQGAEFTAMTPAARSAWAAKAVAELERLDSDCVSLGPEGDALRPIVQRLEGQLRGLLAGDMAESQGGRSEGRESSAAKAAADAATITPNEAPNGDEDPRWATLRAMQTELAQAEKSGELISPARLQQMLNVLGAAAEVADMTDTQEHLLQNFGEGLRRQVETATAVPDGGDGEDSEGDDDALDSLRVSLQTLLDVAQEDGGASGAELSSIAAKTEELISMADEAGVRWREDAQCGRAVRSILEILQETGITGGQGISNQARAGDTAASAPSKVEEVLKATIQALADAPPTDKDGFTPFMRVLQLAQPAAEQMTNRELVLLKTLQEGVIEAMRRLPRPPHPIGELDGKDGSASEHRGEAEEEEKPEGEGEEKDDVDAVLDALLDMSFKLRDCAYTAEQLDEFEAIQHDLEELLTRAGVDSTEAMASVREQIRLQRNALRRAEGVDGEDGKEEEAGEEKETSPPSAGQAMGDAGVADAAQPREGTDAFNEDDDDDETANDETGKDGAAAEEENKL
jgi:hypothetical protein